MLIPTFTRVKPAPGSVLNLKKLTAIVAGTGTDFSPEPGSAPVLNRNVCRYRYRTKKYRTKLTAFFTAKNSNTAKGDSRPYNIDFSPGLEATTRRYRYRDVKISESNNYEPVLNTNVTGGNTSPKPETTNGHFWYRHRTKLISLPQFYCVRDHYEVRNRLFSLTIFNFSETEDDGLQYRTENRHFNFPYLLTFRDHYEVRNRLFSLTIFNFSETEDDGLQYRTENRHFNLPYLLTSSFRYSGAINHQTTLHTGISISTLFSETGDEELICGKEYQQLYFSSVNCYIYTGIRGQHQRATMDGQGRADTTRVPAALCSGGETPDDPAILRRGPVLRHNEDALSPQGFNLRGLTGTGLPCQDIEMSGAGEDESGSGINMGLAYRQCSAAKAAGMVGEMAMVTLSSCGGPSSITPVAAKIEPVGKLDNNPEEEILTKLFRGARMCRGNQLVNDCISTTVDPANLACIRCTKEHKIKESPSPSIIVATDQNMIPAMGGECADSAVVTVRLENGSLEEIGGLFIEMFEHSGALKPGSVLLLGSFTNLAVGGAAGYSRDWVATVDRLKKKFLGLTICPMVPILREDCEGSLAYEIMMLTYWFGKVYNGDRTGIIDTWRHLLDWLNLSMVGHVELATPTTIRTCMPASLSNCNRACITTFSFNCSSPARIKKPDREALNGLVRVLSQVLSRDFGLRLIPEVILSREPAPGGIKDETTRGLKLVTVGASILGRVSGIMAAQGHDVTNLCTPGWAATPENIETLAAKLDQLTVGPDTVVIFDLFGNTTYRYREFDGSISMIKKRENGYHAEGPVTIAEDFSLKNIVEGVGKILKSKPECFRVIVPPLPRYLFSGCCSNNDHCTNLGEEGHAKKLLGRIEHARGVIKGALVRSGIERFWLVDGVGLLAGGSGTGCSAISDPESLRRYLGADGVHLSQEGYRRVADGLLKIAAEKHASPPKKDPENRGAYWRGFLSPVGSLERTRPGGESGQGAAGGRWPSGRERQYGGRHPGPYHRRGGHGRGGGHR